MNFENMGIRANLIGRLVRKHVLFMGGAQAKVDKVGQWGRRGKKIMTFCGCLFWMVPNDGDTEGWPNT